MAEETRFAAYFSHSWRPRDADLNLLIWEEICSACELLVDVPEIGGEAPPYYVNRVEELLRRSDLFLGALTYRAEAPGGGQERDAALKCSPYAAFEVRLAERFDRPRLVLYERQSGFKAPRTSRAHEVYVAFDRGVAETCPDPRQWRNTIAPKIRQWIAWAREHRKPIVYDQSSLAVNLLPPSVVDEAGLGPRVEQALREAGYERVALHAAFRSSIEAFDILHDAGLVLTDATTSDPVARELTAVAHGLGIPAIRLWRADRTLDALPWLLRGYTGGYEEDLVRWSNTEELLTGVRAHAAAMFRTSPALGGPAGRQYLHSKRYAQHFVFLSHTLKPPHRELVNQIYDVLRQRYVKPFEYHRSNAPGEDWKAALDVQLRQTTHFVALLNDGYEQSPMCTYELEHAIQRGAAVRILPFMIGGRSAPNPKLAALNQHHYLLEAPDPRANAAVIAEKILEALAQGTTDGPK